LLRQLRRLNALQIPEGRNDRAAKLANLAFNMHRLIFHETRAAMDNRGPLSPET
jgi:hypothetical protein